MSNTQPKPSAKTPARMLPKAGKLPGAGAANKPFQSAGGLLGRTGGAGTMSGAPLLKKPTIAMPLAADSSTKAGARTAHADGGQGSPVAKLKGKPEARRPTGRAVSGS